MHGEYPEYPGRTRRPSTERTPNEGPIMNSSCNASTRTHLARVLTQGYSEYSKRRCRTTTRTTCMHGHAWVLTSTHGYSWVLTQGVLGVL